MQKSLKLMFLALVCLTLTGCSEDILPVARDITNVELMRTLALDKGEQEGNVLVTVAGGVRPGDQGSDPQPPIILKWEAPTVFSACLTIQTYGDGYVSYGHVGQCVLSADTADEAIAGLLDFIERDFEMRMDTNIYVTPEGKAADLLTKVASKDKSATDRLDSIARDLPLESYGWAVSIRDFLIDMEDNGCALAPAVELKEEEEETTISCERMCWFQEGSYGDVLDQERSRAVTILAGQAKSSPIEVELSDGGLVGLRLTDVQCDWKPNWDGEMLTGAEVKVNVKADLAELRGQTDIYQTSVQQEMDQKLSEQLKKSLEELLALSQRNNADFLHLRRKFQVQCPAKKQALTQHWDDWFQEMDFQIKVDSVVERSYDINQTEETP